MYMQYYNSGLFDLTKEEHTTNLLDDEVKILDNGNIYMEFLCTGDTLGDFQMWAKDINLDQDVTILQNQ